MAKIRKPRRTSPESLEAPHGRATPVIGSRKAPKKVRPIKADPAIERPYEPDALHRHDDNPWQDPGGPEPANG